MDREKTIETLQTLMERYRIRCLAVHYQQTPNLLYAEAMGTRFFAQPHKGEPDWELLLLKLERWKNGNFRDIHRVREELCEEND